MDGPTGVINASLACKSWRQYAITEYVWCEKSNLDGLTAKAEAFDYTVPRALADISARERSWCNVLNRNMLPGRWFMFYARAHVKQHAVEKAARRAAEEKACDDRARKLEREKAALKAARRRQHMEERVAQRQQREEEGVYL